MSMKDCIPADRLRPWLGGLSWCACGAETGPRKRSAELAWFRDLRDQCRDTRTPFFLKKLSDGTRELDGRKHEEFPNG